MTIRARNLAALAVVATGLAACGGDTSSSSAPASSASGGSSATPSSAASPAAGNGGGNAVTIIGLMFQQGALRVPAGTSVTWTNSDTTTHTVTSDAGDPASFDSGNLAPGKTFSFTFMAPGTYKYHCQIHEFMTATVTVSG